MEVIHRIHPLAGFLIALVAKTNDLFHGSPANDDRDEAQPKVHDLLEVSKMVFGSKSDSDGP